jgi:pyrimidine deaminase RibD-like protein
MLEPCQRDPDCVKTSSSAKPARICITIGDTFPTSAGDVIRSILEKLLPEQAEAPVAHSTMPSPEPTGEA